MNRTRVFRGTLPATVLVVLIVSSAVAWKIVKGRGLDRPIKVLRIAAVPSGVPSGAGPGQVRPAEARDVSASPGMLAEPVARAPLDDVARRPDGGAPAEAPVRRLEGAAFIAKVERAAPLSRSQLTRLTNTLQLAATVQKHIDGTEDPAARSDLQRRLDDQVRTRLQMILPREVLAQADDVDENRGPVAFQFGSATGAPR